jgi:hypothetical protein
MNNQLFLIIVIIVILLIIHKTSNTMPVSTPTNSVPVQLPQLENVLKNVLSNTMPVVQEPFTQDIRNTISNDMSKDNLINLLDFMIKKTKGQQRSMIDNLTVSKLNQLKRAISRQSDTKLFELKNGSYIEPVKMIQNHTFMK